MNSALTYSTLFFIILTLVVLIIGIVLMAVGGKINKKYSNQLMMARVSLQFIALSLLIIAAFLHGSS